MVREKKEKRQKRMKLEDNAGDIDYVQSGNDKNDEAIEEFTEDKTLSTTADKIQDVQATHLPDELWHKIFSYLATPFVLKNFALVCQRFGKLSHDGYWMRSVSLNRNVVARSCYDQVLEVLSKATCLQELKVPYFEETSEYNEIMRTVLQNSKTLKKLIIHSTFFDGNFLQCGTSLEHLGIEGPTFSEQAFGNIVQMKRLKSICLLLDDGRAFQGFRLEHLIAIANDFPNLESIRISCIIFDVPELERSEANIIFTSFYQRMANKLKCFDFNIKYRWVAFNHRDSVVLYEGIDSCELLEHLTVHSDLDSLTNTEWNSISKLPKLRCLKMTDHRQMVPARKLKTFFDALDISEIIKLDVSDTKFSKITLNAIMKRGSFPKLEYLWLNHCEVGKDVEYMKKFIRTCPRLKFISLEGVFTKVKLKDLRSLESAASNRKLQINIGKYFVAEPKSDRDYLNQQYNREVTETTLRPDCQH